MRGCVRRCGEGESECKRRGPEAAAGRPILTHAAALTTCLRPTPPQTWRRERAIIAGCCSWKVRARHATWRGGWRRVSSSSSRSRRTPSTSMRCCGRGSTTCPSPTACTTFLRASRGRGITVPKPQRLRPARSSRSRGYICTILHASGGNCSLRWRRCRRTRRAVWPMVSCPLRGEHSGCTVPLPGVLLSPACAANVLCAAQSPQIWSRGLWHCVELRFSRRRRPCVREMIAICEGRPCDFTSALSGVGGGGQRRVDHRTARSRRRGRAPLRLGREPLQRRTRQTQTRSAGRERLGLALVAVAWCVQVFVRVHAVDGAFVPPPYQVFSVSQALLVYK